MLNLTQAIKKVLKDNEGYWGVIDISCKLYALEDYRKSIATRTIRELCDVLVEQGHIRTDNMASSPAYSAIKGGEIPEGFADRIMGNTTITLSRQEKVVVKLALCHYRDSFQAMLDGHGIKCSSRAICNAKIDTIVEVLLKLTNVGG